MSEKPRYVRILYASKAGIRDTRTGINLDYWSNTLHIDKMVSEMNANPDSEICHKCLRPIGDAACPHQG